MSSALLITCEHGGNRIPEPYREYFRGHEALLATHRGYDAGALSLARALAAAFHAPLVAATVSRLLVDLNRSVGHRALHFDSIRRLPAIRRQRILVQYYHPHRSRVEQRVSHAIAEHGRVIHIACHSFTPQLAGRCRMADVGLLYDPARSAEAAFCARWKAALRDRAPKLTVRRNYPYQGKDDGLTTWLRERWPRDAYLGMELEMNQRLIAAPVRQWTELRRQIIDSLSVVLAGLPHARGESPSSASPCMPRSATMRRTPTARRRTTGVPN